VTTIPEVVAEINDLKTKAKNRRDTGRFDRAMKMVMQAAALAEEAFASSSGAERRDLATQLSDVYGIAGGIARRQAFATEHGSERDDFLEESVRLYDQGYEFEQAEYGVVNSYNLVNRIVARVVARPEALDSAEPVGADAEPLHEMIRHARDVVADQILDLRRSDPWALADQALLDVLETPSADATSAYGPLHRMSPPDYLYESALDTLRSLVEAIGATRPELSRAIKDLESRRHQAD
jgi:hypothetical protein